MYCKNCHALLDENTNICKSCGFDNTNINKAKVKDLEKLSSSLEKKNPKNKIIFIIIIVITALLVVGYIFYSEILKTKEENSTTTTKLACSSYLNKDFKFDILTFKYPDTFKSTTNTIFYEKNAAINVTFKMVDSIEYQELLSTDDTLDSKIGNINTKTFAKETSYTHLFNINDKYYVIIVNYVNDLNTYNECVQLDIHAILNSINE